MSLSLVVVSLWMQPRFQFSFAVALPTLVQVVHQDTLVLQSLYATKVRRALGLDGLSAGFVFLQGVLFNLAGCHIAVPCDLPRERGTATRHG